MRKLALISLFALSLVVLLSGTAFAAHLGLGDRGKDNSTGCSECHAGATYRTSGPHGGYTISTNRCIACHAVHEADNPSLLPGATVTAVCQYCHDLTQTAFGPYYMGEGATVKSAHRVEGLNLPNGYTNENGVVVTAGVVGAVYGTGVIPGGNKTDGSAGNLDTTTQGGLSGSNFTCNSCHTPHAIAGSTVEPYLGESAVKDNATGTIFMTDRILKNKPNNAAVAVTEYGSKWCLACHAGRDDLDLETKHNHPVNENAPAYRFLDIVDADAAWLTDRVTVETYKKLVIGTDVAADPRTNKQYALVEKNAATDTVHPDGYMSYAAIAAEGGPSCQQCHASARDLTAAFDITHQTTDPKTTIFPNPQRLTFPHVSTNKALLVQENDKFCTSCHGISNLP